jgi:hypothetical protein
MIHNNPVGGYSEGVEGVRPYEVEKTPLLVGSDYEGWII